MILGTSMLVLIGYAIIKRTVNFTETVSLVILQASSKRSDMDTVRMMSVVIAIRGNQ